MKKTLMIFLLILFITGCKNKKIKLAENAKVEIADFVEFFPEIKLPFQTDDSLLFRKETDSLTIGYKIFTQFIPDSVLTMRFEKEMKIKIYPLGRVALKKAETYLFLKVTSPSKKAVFVIALDNENKFIAGMPLVMDDKDPSTEQKALMDKKYTVTQITQKKNQGGETVETKNVFILNAEARNFSLIMTDQGIPEQEREIINPIDTLPRKNKFSGDYIKDKRNYVSVRDGKTATDLLFFIHFEKNNGECAGELKGEASMHGTRTALFRAIGNPCVLELNLSATSVSLKEQQACGSYRDIKCFFDGIFIKRKELKSKVISKKKKQ